MMGRVGCSSLLLLLACGGQAHRPDRVTADSWAAMSTVGSPIGRVGHASVWTGTEMIVWGGTGEKDGELNVLFDDGGRYRPSEDVWAAMSSSGGPGPRSAPSVVWAGSKLFVWGGGPSKNGEGPASPPFDDGALYDPLTDSWSPVSTRGAPEGRKTARAVWTGTEALVWGGVTWDAEDVTTQLSTGARYDPASDRWTAMATDGAPVADRPFAVWTDHVMLVFDYISEPPDRGGALYDPSTDTWTPMTSAGMPEGHLCGPVWTGTELAVFDSDQSAVARYDPARDEWNVTAIGEPLCGVITPVWTGERVLYWGPGSSPPGPRVKLDLESGLATPLADRNEPSPRTSHTALWTGTEMIVWGGVEDGGSYTNTGGRYTP